MDEELDRLFGLPLEEFTAARNDLARRLKPGDPDAAEEVKRLPKPSVPAWTVNRLVRDDPDGVRDLLAAGEALRAAQQRLLAGDDAADELRKAGEQEREAVRLLTGRARDVLKEAGRPATEATLERVVSTLRAAAVTDEGRELLRTGRLTEELQPPGFDQLTGTGTPPRRRRSADRTTADRRRHDQEQRRRRELREQARALEQAARAAEREAERAEQVAGEARRRAERARAEADSAAALLTHEKK